MCRELLNHGALDGRRLRGSLFPTHEQRAALLELLDESTTPVPYRLALAEEPELVEAPAQSASATRTARCLADVDDICPCNPLGFESLACDARVLAFESSRRTARQELGLTIALSHDDYTPGTAGTSALCKSAKRTKPPKPLAPRLARAHSITSRSPSAVDSGDDVSQLVPLPLPVAVLTQIRVLVPLHREASPERAGVGRVGVFRPLKLTCQLHSFMDSECSVICRAASPRARPVRVFVRQEDDESRSPIRLGPPLQPRDVVNEVQTAEVSC